MEQGILYMYYNPDYIEGVEHCFTLYFEEDQIAFLIFDGVVEIITVAPLIGGPKYLAREHIDNFMASRKFKKAITGHIDGDCIVTYEESFEYLKDEAKKALEDFTKFVAVLPKFKTYRTEPNDIKVPNYYRLMDLAHIMKIFL